MKRQNLYLLLLTVFPVMLHSQSSWTRITPTPQENTINDIVKIPGTSKVIAVCGGSTYMITEDLGNSWQVFTNPANKDNGFSCVSVFFSNPTKGFITGSDKSILKTTDGGQTWIEIYTSASMYPWEKYYDINFSNPFKGVAVGYQGNILFSDDGGDMWDSTASGVDFDIYAADFCTINKVFAVGDDHNLILVSNDAGETWSTQAISPPISGGTLKDILFVNNNIGFITVNNGSSSKILRTENGGDNWVTVWNGSDYLPNKIDFYDEMHGAVSCGRNMYESGMLLTHDGGLTWEGIPIGEFSWFADRTIIMTDNNDVLMAGNMGMIFQSDFGGQTWDLKSERTFWGGVFEVQFTDALTGYALAENHTGGISAHDLMKTTNGGLTWNAVGMGDTYNQASFCFVDNEIGYYANNSFSTEIYKTTNGGEDWVLLNSDNFDFNPICTKFYNESFGLICGTNNIIRTEDGGNTWELVYQGAFTDDHWDIYFKSENEIMVSGSYFYQTYLIHSTDGGDTWESEFLADFGSAFDIEFLNSDTGFLACGNNMILKTIDGGDNWEETTVNSEEGTQFFKIQFPSIEVGYASAYGPQANFFMTTDLGENWEPVVTPSTGGLFDFHFFNDETGLAFGGNGLVIKTGEILQLNPPVNFTLEQGYNSPLTIFYLCWEEPDLTNTPDLVGYNVYRNDTLLTTLDPSINEYEEELNPFGGWGPFVCYYITAVYENPAGESVPTQELCGGWLTMVNQYKMEETKLICHPNPFKNNTQIHFNTLIQQKGEIRIFNQTGKQILSYPVNHTMKSIEISGDKLKPGVYFYQLKTDDGASETKKMIKIE